MGKLESNKLQKRTSLLNTAFNLFTTKGVSKTSIAEISKNAGIAKGTFYLYFKDKYDIRNKLVSYKTKELFYHAYQSVLEHEITGFDNQLHFMVDFILDSLEQDYALLVFISKNLSWGVFQAALDDKMPDSEQQFYQQYLELIKKDGRTYDHPDLMLFSIIELASSTCYSCILYQQPVSLAEYRPYLHRTIDAILTSFESKGL